ncbi:ABC transporter ATP-binding protein [Mesotoga sp. H07.pep.5.3]|uniref:ABC transporter ATP-binding protein n=1 Tax=Mesotoga sp. H07.pep.5.3 TaxID=1421003 RepID=UPI000C18D532|nr:ABC transporter ATP-binding protein [Mesotoga sp. H07.pep.5.3]PIJ60654.1 peptide ABC transporter ATPase [Mesotoga sp. H07.pep.5.3]
MNRQESEQLLQCRNLVAGYRIKSGFVHAVDDVSFDLERGGFLGIAGESGCGKSTLAFAIMRLLKDNATIENGSLLFKGTDLVGLREEEMKKIRWVDISMAFQSAMNALNPVLSIGEQLTDVIHAHGEVRQSEARDRALEALKLVDIPRDRFNSYPHQLSGGMKQRVMIAMALILNPDLIIMDEPTTALDVVVQRTIIEKIQELRKSLGFSVIFITHDLSLLVEISDTLAIMYAGKIVEYGNSDELFNMPLHPYTIGLMNSFPSLTGKITRMGGIEGKPPDLLNPPEGCRFHPRCPHAMDICEKSCPALQKVDPRHSVACFLHKGAETL